MREQHVHVFQHLRPVAGNQPCGGPLDHVDVGLIKRRVVAVRGGREHRVVTQIVGARVAGVPLCRNAVFRQIG